MGLNYFRFSIRTRTLFCHYFSYPHFTKKCAFVLGSLLQCTGVLFSHCLSVCLSVSGTFAVVCLMVGHVCEREVQGMVQPTTSAPSTLPPAVGTTVNVSNFASMVVKEEQSSSEMSWEDAKKLEVALALSMLIGLIKVCIIKSWFMSIYIITVTLGTYLCMRS